MGITKRKYNKHLVLLVAFLLIFVLGTLWEKNTNHESHSDKAEEETWLDLHSRKQLTKKRNSLPAHVLTPRTPRTQNATQHQSEQSAWAKASWEFKMKLLSRAVGEKKLKNLLQSAEIQNSVLRKPQTTKKIIIASTWRSGSTFLLYLIASHPGVYETMEPLAPMGYHTFYDPQDTKAQKSLVMINDTFDCRYVSIVENIRGRGSSFVSPFSHHWIKACAVDNGLTDGCLQTELVEHVCSMFPIKVVKLTRMGLKLLQPFLTDDETLQLIYLVRDPRAILSSREIGVTWCTTPECYDVSILCKHMDIDLEVYRDLSSQFPNRVHLLRYEDLCLEPYKLSKSLMKRLNLSFDPKVVQYLDSHTTQNIDSPFAINRMSREHIIEWVNEIQPQSLKMAQSVCQNVMKRLGYLSIKSTENISLNDVLSLNVFSPWLWPN